MPTVKPKVSTVRIDLEGRYAGWWADCDDDPDGAFLEDLSRVITTGQFGPTWDALLRVVVNWNFTDKAGQPVPVDAEGIRKVSARALLALAKGYMQTWSALPN
jgi:hypothetical protein